MAVRRNTSAADRADTAVGKVAVGSFAVGKIADIVILDKDLNVKDVILRGKVL